MPVLVPAIVKTEPTTTRSVLRHKRNGANSTSTPITARAQDSTACPKAMIDLVASLRRRVSFADDGNRRRESDGVDGMNLDARGTSGKRGELKDSYDDAA